MTIVRIRAVYESGSLRPLDPVDLQEGQQVESLPMSRRMIQFVML
jgi:predicted DNA-binding antitoxin AbrB/MazE fold protein